MAWPKTPLTNYIANFLPKIKSFDLNIIQTTINSLVKGTLSVNSLTIDGTGGSVGAQFEGAFDISAIYASTTLPTTIVNTVPRPISKETVLAGIATIDSQGNLIRGNNVVSSTKLGFARFQITFNQTRLTDTVNQLALVQYDHNTPGNKIPMANCESVTGGIVTIRVYEPIGNNAVYDPGPNDRLHIFLFGA